METSLISLFRIHGPVMVFSMSRSPYKLVKRSITGHLSNCDLQIVAVSELACPLYQHVFFRDLSEAKEIAHESFVVTRLHNSLSMHKQVDLFPLDLRLERSRIISDFPSSFLAFTEDSKVCLTCFLKQ